MASMREIKRRRESIQSTGQITRAMKLVATVRLQRARTKAENTLPYFRALYHTIAGILRRSEGLSHPYLTPKSGTNPGIIVITSNRGLAGSYNAGLVKAVADQGFEAKKTGIYAAGRRGRDMLAGLGYSIRKDYPDIMNAPSVKDADRIGQEVLRAFDGNEIDEIWLAFTGFQNTVIHIPAVVRILPVDTQKTLPFLGAGEEDGKEDFLQMNYEPGEEEVLRVLIPDYISSMIYGGLIQSFASENAARMQAMDSASSNAEDLMAALEQTYHRARQASITRELTEITAGSQVDY